MKRIQKYSELIFLPIRDNLPFFVCSFLLLGTEAFQNIHGRWVTKDSNVEWIELFCRLATTMFVVYLLTVIVNITNKCWVKYFTYFFVTGLFGVALFLRLLFGLQISPTIFLLLFETTESESTEFINTFILSEECIKIIIPLLVSIFCICFCEFLYKKFHRYFNKFSKELSLLFFIPFVFSVCSGTYSFYRLFNCKSTDAFIHLDSYNWFPNDPVSRSLYGLYGLYIMNKEQSKMDVIMKNIDNTLVSIKNEDSLNIVLVIGESYIKSHSQLYGYYLRTTPNLVNEQKKGNLFAFNNVVTPFNITTLAIKNMLCTNSVGDGESWSTTPFFPAIFKKAGFDVYMWDNQKTWGEHTSFVLSLNSFLYNHIVKTRSYTNTNSNNYLYDEELIKSFESIQLKSSKNLVIFHLLGQHVNYSERYPHIESFERFTPDSIIKNEEYINQDKKAIIATYDNATLYNDFVLNKIFNCFRGSNSMVVYLSDHGDEVYDYRDCIGRRKDNMSPNSTKYQYEIPFMIWFSDIFLNNNHEFVKKIANALDRPFMSDNLCQILFNIGQIETTYYKEERNPISNKFIPPKRVLEYFYDYDSIMSTKNANYDTKN